MVLSYNQVYWTTTSCKKVEEFLPIGPKYILDIYIFDLLDGFNKSKEQKRTEQEARG